MIRIVAAAAFVVVLVLGLGLGLVACETTPYQTTALDGGIACGTSSCASGEVCVEQAAGIDAADGHDTATRFCFAPPNGCYVFNCHGVKCAPCLLALCALCTDNDSGCNYVDVAERNVYCPGQ